MKILSNEEYDKLINDEIPINPSIEYYMNNPYQARKIEKLEDYNIELEIKIDKKDKEIERLNSIIKEVREYVERYLRLNLEAFDTKDLLEKILEILDKVSK